MKPDEIADRAAADIIAGIREANDRLAQSFRELARSFVRLVVQRMVSAMSIRRPCQTRVRGARARRRFLNAKRRNWQVTP